MAAGRRPQARRSILLIDPNSKYLYGIDISSWNKVYDYDLVAENVDFVYLKATEGKTNRSKVYEERVYEFQKRDILVGAYHFSWLKKWGINEPELQAKWFAETIAPLGPGSLLPVMDIETGWFIKNWKLIAWMERFMEVAEDECDSMIGIYTFRNYHRYKLKAEGVFDRPLWLASTCKITKDNRPKRDGPKKEIKGWDTSLWQYSHRGKIPGIKGNVDLNRMNVEDLTTWMVEKPFVEYPA